MGNRYPVTILDFNKQERREVGWSDQICKTQRCSRSREGEFEICGIDPEGKFDLGKNFSNPSKVTLSGKHFNTGFT